MKNEKIDVKREKEIITTHNIAQDRNNLIVELLNQAAQLNLQGHSKESYDCYREIELSINNKLSEEERHILHELRKWLVKRCKIWNPRYIEYMKEYFPDGKPDTYHRAEDWPYEGRKKKMSKVKMAHFSPRYKNYINKLLLRHGFDGIKEVAKEVKI